MFFFFNDLFLIINTYVITKKKIMMSFCEKNKNKKKTLFKKHKSVDTKLGPCRSVSANNNGGQRR